MNSNKQKIIKIMYLCIFLIVVIVIVSFFIEKSSQRLPAVVRTHKVVISSETSGTVLNYEVSSMQKVIAD